MLRRALSEIEAKGEDIEEMSENIHRKDHPIHPKQLSRYERKDIPVVTEEMDDESSLSPDVPSTSKAVSTKRRSSKKRSSPPLKK